MNKKNFGLLLGSMREGAQILRGEHAPSRRSRDKRKYSLCHIPALTVKKFTFHGDFTFLK